jgi:hypothetical protein
LLTLRKIFNRLHWFTEQKTGNKDILHYLDDFLFGAKADSPKCQFTLQTFRDICKLWGVPVAEDKTVEPTESFCAKEKIIQIVQNIFITSLLLRKPV